MRARAWTILIALVVSTLLYMVVALVAVSSGAIDELAESEAPLALIYQRAAGQAPVLISSIAMVAVVNGALIQIIMASRVCYGLANQGWIPAVLGQGNPRTRTPLIATLLVSVIVLVMALWLPIETLARFTSLLLLIVFAAINLALIRIQRNPELVHEGFSVPRWVPFAGSASAAAFLAYQVFSGVLA